MLPPMQPKGGRKQEKEHQEANFDDTRSLRHYHDPASDVRPFGLCLGVNHDDTKDNQDQHSTAENGAGKSSQRRMRAKKRRKYFIHYG